MWCSLALFSLLVASAAAVTPTTVLSQADQSRLKALFKSSENLKDVASAHYAAEGLKLLGEAVDQGTCNAVQKAVDSSNIQSVYHAASAARLAGNCKINVANAESLLVVGDTNAASLYYAVAARSALGLKIDETAAAKALDAIVKDSKATIASYGYAFMTASLLSPSKDLKPVSEMIEDVTNMADEIGGYLLSFLHFDQDGVPITAAVVKGMFDLAAKSGSAPAGIKESQVVMFANYFLRSKHTGSVTDAYHVLAALTTLANNKYFSPLAITLASNGVISENNAVVQVRATNLLDQPVKGVDVTLVTAGQEGAGELVSDVKLKSVGNGLFETKLGNSPARGIYSCKFSAASKEKAFVDVDEFEVNVQIIGSISLSAVEFAITDADQGVKAKSLSLKHPNAVTEKLSADHHQKMSLQFSVNNAQGEAVTVHQSFIQLKNEKNGNEIFFVAESNENDEYKIEVNLGTSAGESFNHESGRYTMTLTIGDGLASNSIVWNFGSIDLSFPGTPAEPKAKLEYGPRKEIKHMFRVPEKRPPAVISNAFTLLVLAPLLILLVSWVRIGVNFNNIGKGGIFSLLFFAGLTSILLLYGYFWLASNMFSTLKGLTALGVPTFFCGRRMLANMAAAQKR